MRASAFTIGAGSAMAQASNPETMANAAKSYAEDLGRQQAAESAVAQAYSTPEMQVYNMDAQSVVAGVNASREMYDAIRLSFEVTSEKDLAQPYYAVIALLRERDSKPGQVRKWAYVKSLGPMSAGVPKNVMVYRGGLPPGYIIEGCEVHLYNEGEEVATNLSRKRVPLTDDEALQFRIIEYVGANKGRTLPATPATTTLAREVRMSLTADQLGGTCYVRVARDGRVAAAFHDAAGRQPLHDPALESALQTLRFKPALEAGKPVESIASFSFAQLAPRVQ
jgi:hypothetical protein